MFDWPSFWEAFPYLLPGLAVTVELAVIAMVGSVVLGTLIALLRLYAKKPFAFAAAIWTEAWISTPLLIQLFWLYYVMPSLFGLQLPGMVVAIFGLLCNNSAYLSEVFRSAIASIGQGQWQAARAMGMSEVQVFFRVIIPQAGFRALPSSANIWVELFKNTSIVSTVAVADLTFRALELRTTNFRTLEVLTALAVFYLVLAYPQAKLADWLDKKINIQE